MMTMATEEISIKDIQTEPDGKKTCVIPIKPILNDFRSRVKPTYGYSDRLLKDFIQMYIEVGLQGYTYAEEHLCKTMPKFFNKPNEDFNPITFLRDWLGEVKFYSKTTEFSKLKILIGPNYLVTEQTTDGVKIIPSDEDMYEPHHRLLNNLDGSMLRPPILKLAKITPPATFIETMDIGDMLSELEYMNGRYGIFLEKDIFKQTLFTYLTDSSRNLQMSYLFGWFKEVYDEYDDRITHVGNNFLAIFSDLKEFITRYSTLSANNIMLKNLEITKDDVLNCEYRLVEPTKNYDNKLAER